MTVLTITDVALSKLVELRDEEPDGDRLGVRLEIISDRGSDFSYDLSFQTVTKAAFTDVVTNHSGLKLIVPEKDLANLEGAELDFELDGLVIRNPNKPKPIQLGTLTIDSPLAQGIQGLLDEEVNPSLAAHGGFVTFLGHDDDNDVYLRMGGGCQGCSMSRVTMAQGVQMAIKDKFPEVGKVVDATDHTAGENPYYH